MNTRPWNRATTYQAANEMSEPAQVELAAFTKWNSALNNWIVGKWTEETGVIASSEPLHEWAWTAGANFVFEHHAAELAEHLATMPAFPAVWPSHWYVNYVRARLSSLDAREPLPFAKDTLLQAARELRRQAIYVLQLAEETEDASQTLHTEAAAAVAA